jgi:hypothetical protein
MSALGHGIRRRPQDPNSATRQLRLAGGLGEQTLVEDAPNDRDRRYAHSEMSFELDGVIGVQPRGLVGSGREDLSGIRRADRDQMARNLRLSFSAGAGRNARPARPRRRS